MNEQLQPCRCGEIGEIYFQTPSFTRFGYRVGLVECNICGEVVSFVSKCMDHPEFCIDATAAWNGRNELDQLRQRVAEVEAANTANKAGFEEYERRYYLEVNAREDAEAKLALAEQDARRYRWLRSASWGDIEMVYWSNADLGTPGECRAAFDASIDAAIDASQD